MQDWQAIAAIATVGLFIVAIGGLIIDIFYRKTSSKKDVRNTYTLFDNSKNFLNVYGDGDVDDEMIQFLYTEMKENKKNVLKKVRSTKKKEDNKDDV
ncbi:MAG: hypothetical protein P9M14_15900 [Candidatus Alcyoniella australis]|nr:hypothetical protein [Candidatus Alcyoniella australis]